MFKRRDRVHRPHHDRDDDSPSPVKIVLSLAILVAVAAGLIFGLSWLFDAVVTEPAVVDNVPTETASAAVTETAVEPTVTAPDPEPTPTPKPPLPDPIPEPVPKPAPAKKPRAFDGDRMMSHVRYLASTIGPRTAGSAGEVKAAQYLKSELEKYGYTVNLQPIALPGGKTTQNVWAEQKGKSSAMMVLGAHYDTKGPSPGANDNGSGTAVTLELARDFKDRPVQPTLRFVFFGAEETVDSNPDHHHYGSRGHVAGLSAAQRASMAGMMSIDMIGYGPGFHSRTMQKGPQKLSDMLLAYSNKKGAGLTFKADPGKTGWSDHEPFELAGIPVSWLEWREDPTYHTAGDDYAHVQSSKVIKTGELVRSFLIDLSGSQVKALLEANTSR